MTLSGLALRASLPLTTTHRLVEELIRYGLIERDPGGQLRVGLRLWELAARGSRALTLREIALPFMEDVQAAVDRYTTLAILDHGSVLFLERLSARDSALESALDAGYTAERAPVHSTSSGLVLLAYSPPWLQEEVLAGPLERVTGETITDPSTIRKHLAEIRQRGYAAIPGIAAKDWTGIAVPVFGAGNSIAAALTATVPRGETNVPVTLPALLTAAHGISRALGADGRSAGSRLR